MRLPFFRAIIYSLCACVASAFVGVIGPVALSQQGSSLPEIQQNQPQLVAPMRPTIVDRDLPGGRESGSQGGWSAIQDETAPTGFDPDRRNDSNVMGFRSFNSSPRPGHRENAFSSEIEGIPVRTSVSEGTRLNENGLNQRTLNERTLNEQGTGGTQLQGLGQNQAGFTQPTSGLPAVQGFGGQQAPSFRDQRQAPGAMNTPGGLLPQNTNPNFQPGRGTSGQGNFDSPLVSMPNGETMAQGNRWLQNDRMDRDRMDRRDRADSTPTGETLLEHQRQIEGWDPSLSLPDIASSVASLPRAGRRASDDGFDDTMASDTRRPPDELPSYQMGGSGDVSANFVKDSNSERQPVNGPDSRTVTSTDQLASLLTVCFFLANLVLAYFLYDSRMKYQHLADEIQARFFREP